MSYSAVTRFRARRLLNAWPILITLLIAITPMLVLAQSPKHSYAEGVRKFDYPSNQPLALRIRKSINRSGVQIYDISYHSAISGEIPAYLVVPHGKGPFAAIVFAHWAMAGSPTRNRTEFLEEAIALARSGAVSLLPDAPFARPNQKEDPNPLSEKSISLFYQQVMDLRRAVDVLVSRSDIDKTRIAFVGHSYDANAGGVLAGVEKRFKAFVLMTGGLADLEGMNTPEFRRAIGDAAVDNYINQYWWLDPAIYLPHAAPGKVLLQYGSKDPTLSEVTALHYFDLVSEPKVLMLYSAGHALNGEAQWDRMAWLARQLDLRALTGHVSFEHTK
jgi:dienelactone hydrolase